MLLLDGDENLTHLAVGTLLRCQQLRRDGFAIPPALAQLRDTLHAAAKGGLTAPVVEQILQPPDAVVVNVPEAARRLSLSARSVRRMVADGRLPVLRIGRRVLVPVAALDRLAREAA